MERSLVVAGQPRERAAPLKSNGTRQPKVMPPGVIVAVARRAEWH
jgi:hypothetical protein